MRKKKPQDRSLAIITLLVILLIVYAFITAKVLLIRGGPEPEPAASPAIVQKKEMPPKQHAPKAVAVNKSAPQSSSDLGISNFTVPELFGSGYNQPVNSWYGYIGGVLKVAMGNSRKGDPAQGVLLVMDSGNAASVKIYDTPGKNGAVKIVAEKGGVLTLKSVAGIDVITGNGVIYHFNLKTRSFQ